MNWLKDFFLCIIMGRIKVEYYDGTVIYFTTDEWFAECKRVRSMVLASKNGLPFVRANVGID